MDDYLAHVGYFSVVVNLLFLYDDPQEQTGVFALEGDARFANCANGVSGFSPRYSTVFSLSLTHLIVRHAVWPLVMCPPHLLQAPLMVSLGGFSRHEYLLVISLLF